MQRSGSWLNPSVWLHGGELQTFLSTVWLRVVMPHGMATFRVRVRVDESYGYGSWSVLNAPRGHSGTRVVRYIISEPILTNEQIEQAASSLETQTLATYCTY